MKAAKRSTALGSPVGEVLPPAVERPVDPVPRVEPLANPVGLPFQVEGAFGVVDLDVVVQVFVAFFRREWAMRRLMAQDEAERLIPILLEPVDRHIGDAVGVVALLYLPRAVDVELGVVVFALALVRYPIIESWASLVALFPHVPLSDIGCLIALLLQLLRKARQIGRVVGEVVHDTVGMGVEAGKEGRPGGGAEETS